MYAKGSGILEGERLERQEKRLATCCARSPSGSSSCSAS